MSALVVTMLTYAAEAGQLSMSGGGGVGMPRQRHFRRGPQVHEHPIAFWISGSSIPTLNGLYKKGELDPMLTKMQHHYYTQANGWALAYVDATVEPYAAVGGLRTEWLLIDPAGNDRFGHKGDTLIPSSGAPAWSHVHRPEFGRIKQGEEVAARSDADWDSSVWHAGDRITVTQAGAVNRQLAVRVSKSGRNVYTDAWRLKKVFDAPASDGGVDADGSALADATPAEPDEGELPWQVLALLDPRTVTELEDKIQKHDTNVRSERMALGRSLPGPAEGGAPPPPLPTAAETTTSCLDGEFEDAVSGFTALLNEAPGPRDAIALHIKRGHCQRRGGDAAAGLADAEAALRMAPAFAPALLEQALAILDMGNATGAIWAAGLLLSTNPDTPNLDHLLLHAHARARRAGIEDVAVGYMSGDSVLTVDRVPGFWEKNERLKVLGLGPPSAPIAIRLERTGRVIAVQANNIKPIEGGSVTAGEGRSTGHDGANAGDAYVILGLPLDFTADQLRQAYRALSRKLHPDRQGGSTDAFQRVAEAHAVLSDPAKREAFDLGLDIPATGREDAPTFLDEIHMRYFPNRQLFKPYGDPLAGKNEYLYRQQQLFNRQRQVEDEREQREIELERRAHDKVDVGHTEL